jgi:hypothetical protein
MIMKHFKILRMAWLLPVAMLGYACSDLALDPRQSVADNAYFGSIGDFRAAAIGLYDQIQLSDWYGRSLPLMAEIMGEDVKQAASANRYQEFADFEGQVVTGHDYETELWAEAYEGINMANQMINANFEPPAGVATEFDQILGEAYAVRALAHFDLVKMYAQHYTFTAAASHPGVPIVLESDVTALPARNTVAEVYDQIISDFNTAISLMTQTRDGPYMFTREAAQALMSRIYLYMEDYGNARTMADAVINSGKYSLVSAQSYLTQFVDGGSSEAILEIGFSETDRNGSDAFGYMYIADGYGDYLPAKDLLDLYDPADIRAGMFAVDPLLSGNYASHRVNKFPTATGTDNIPIIRLSEVYLNRAEANAQLGNDGPAQDDLDLIRQRALPTAPDVTATGQALINEILVERRKELGYEGHGVLDITRNRRDVVRDDCTGDVCTYTYPGNFFVLPIPQEEMDANPNMTQNTGYAGAG